MKPLDRWTLAKLIPALTDVTLRVARRQPRPGRDDTMVKDALCHHRRHGDLFGFERAVYAAL